MNVFAPEKLTTNWSKTPEGFLLIRNIPMARTGVMLYAAGELDSGAGEDEIEPDSDGVIRVQRDPEVLFSPNAISSFLGKAVTDEHPPIGLDVTNDNWGEYAKGMIVDVRRGSGIFDNILYGDILVTSKDLIATLVAKKKRQVSAGYDADYEQDEPGTARMASITGNHLAIVSAGRCGPTCTIGDSQMPTPAKRTIKDRIMTAFRAKDEAAMADELANLDDGDSTTAEGTHIHLHMPAGGDPAGTPPAARADGPLAENKVKTDDDLPAGTAADPAQPQTPPAGQQPTPQVPPWFADYSTKMDARIGAIESTLASLAGNGSATPAANADPAGTMDEFPHKDETPEETKARKAQEEKMPTKDSAEVMTAFRDTIARAEILAPGIKLITMDGKATIKTTRDAMCGFRRAALTRAAEDSAKAALISPLLAGRKIANLSCQDVQTTFIAASELVRVSNNGLTRAFALDALNNGAMTPAERNKINREYWSKQQH